MRVKVDLLTAAIVIPFELVVKSSIVFFVLEPPVNNDALANRRIEGSVKLNLFYKQDTLTIMVMHVKDLVRSTAVALTRR